MGVEAHCPTPQSIGYATTISPEAIERAIALGDIDLYITGETSLYLLEYAKHHHISVAIYSHNYSELPGVEEFAKRLGQQLQLEVKGHLGDSHF